MLIVLTDYAQTWLSPEEMQGILSLNFPAGANDP